jgi:hypothetical protein
MLEQKIKLPLFFLRLSVALVMWVWVVDKFVNVQHTVNVWKAFYFVDNLPLNGSYIIGVLQAIVVLAFTFGFKKKISYGIVFIMHLGSTLTPFARYLDPYTLPNILFFPAWTMLAAIFALYWLRDYDTIGTFDSNASKIPE